MLVRRVFFFALLLLPCSAGAEPKRSIRPRAITQCPWDGQTFSLLDPPAISPVLSFNDLVVTGRMQSDHDSGAIFVISRNGQVILTKAVPDLVNPNGWLGYSSDLHSFALNTSNGGAAGGWSVSLFHEDSNGHVQDLTSSMHTVERHFSARHTCKTRGNNYEAIQWRSNANLLISASVYGTSDCGQEMGHTEGYLLDVLTSRIVAHYTEHQMLNLPYVCTYNVWQPGDPDLK